MRYERRLCKPVFSRWALYQQHGSGSLTGWKKVLQKFCKVPGKRLWTWAVQSLQPLRMHSKLVVRRPTQQSPLILHWCRLPCSEGTFWELSPGRINTKETSCNFAPQNTVAAARRAKRPWACWLLPWPLSFRGNPICSPYFLFNDVTNSVDSPVTADVNEKPPARRNQPNAPLELPYFCLSRNPL
jgi:hypothetical protein